VATLAQLSFSGGEITPSLYGRVDQSKYQTGLRTLRNYIVMRHGGAQNRPGTGFIGEVSDSSKTVKTIPFIFNADQTYLLEFGDEYMRVIRNGAYQYDLTLTITGITNASPGVVTYTGTDPSNGDEVYISGVVGNMANNINGRNFKIANVDTGANTFELKTMEGVNFSTTSLGTYTSGGTAKRVYTITTPYDYTDLQTLNYDQSADIITLTHPSYAPRELARTGHTAWTLTTITFAPSTSSPTGCGATGGSGSTVLRYKVTAVDADTFVESLAGVDGTKSNSITGISQANPAVVTYSGSDNFTEGDTVRITGVVGMTQVNDLEFVVGTVNTGANTFQLRGINSTAYTAWSSGGTVAVVSVSRPLDAAADVTITWTAVANAIEYNVYKELNGVYGFIGVAGSTTFIDDVSAYVPDTSDTAPSPRNPFGSANNYPSTSAYYGGSHLFANTNNDTEAVWKTRSGDFKNLTARSPLQADDAHRFILAGRGVNEVRALVDLGNLVGLTAGVEWRILGDANGIISPGQANPVQQSYNGIAEIRPLVIDNSALYVQARGSQIRDLAYDFAVDDNGRTGYRGNDLTVFSAHLVDDYTIRDWDYQQIPHSIVWAVRNDGVLLGLTYIKAHQMLAWHRHDVQDGTVEQVCVVPEGGIDRVYLVVKRTINGLTKRYIERMHPRNFSDITTDAIFVDSSLSYDGRNVAATTMTLSGGTNWTYDETLTLTSSAAEFDSDDVGHAIQLTSSTGAIIRFVIEVYSSTTVVTGKAHMTVPASLRNTATSTWTHAVDHLTGLWHLEGKSVSVFADGYVIANPNNDSYTTVTVANGSIQLDKAYGVIHVGLPFTSDIETLDATIDASGTFVDKKKLINQATVYVEKTRGLWCGTEAPTSDSNFKTQLKEFKLRSTEGYNAPPALQTKAVNVKINGTWNDGGRVFLRQTDPIPATILTIAPAGYLPVTA
jgi:heptaprenylglyceryl phosphate synthase